MKTTVATVRRWRERFEAEGLAGLIDAPRPGAPKADLSVTDTQRTELERLARANRNVALRAKVVLACAEGLANAKVSKQLPTTPATVSKWRKRFVTGGVDGLLDEPRPGAPRTIMDDEVEAIIVKTLETQPKGRTHWSARKMAEEAGVSQTTVGRIWRTFGRQPHVVKSFKFIDDPLFVEKVHDIVGLYMNPPNNAVVFSFDEKPQT